MYSLVIIAIDGETPFLQLMGFQKVQKNRCFSIFLCVRIKINLCWQ